MKPNGHSQPDAERLIKALGSYSITGKSFGEILKICDDTRASGNSVFFIGNGGSAAIASHMAADWMKNGKFKAQCFNESSQLTCLSNDLGYGSVFSEPIRRFGEPGDLLFAISSSGSSINIINAANAAIDRGMIVVTLSGFLPDNNLRSIGNANVWVPSAMYGVVEIAHLAFLHMILDALTERS